MTSLVTFFGDLLPLSPLLGLFPSGELNPRSPLKPSSSAIELTSSTLARSCTDISKMCPSRFSSEACVQRNRRLNQQQLYVPIAEEIPSDISRLWGE
jgi:hypothetical protein